MGMAVNAINKSPSKKAATAPTPSRRLSVLASAIREDYPKLLVEFSDISLQSESLEISRYSFSVRITQHTMEIKFPGSGTFHEWNSITDALSTLRQAIMAYHEAVCVYSQ